MKKILTLITILCFVGALAVAKTSAVIEERKTHLLVSARDQLTVTEYMRIRILDEDGYQHAIFHDYYNTFKKIKSLRYTIFDAGNKKVKRFSKMDALDVMFNSTYEIGDARMLILDPRYGSFPFTAVIEVESVYNGFLGFPLWMPRHAHDIEVASAELTLECFKDFKFRSRELNGVDVPEITETDKTKTIRWSVSDLPAIEKHLSYKSFAADQPKVHLAPVEFAFGNTTGDFSTWADFGQWYHALNKGRDEIGSSTKRFLDGLRDEYGDDTGAIAKAAYTFMQGKTRYISIQLGIGGYQTIPSDVVERTGYGDCKALTNYMAAMLKYLDIPSNPVLVYAGADVPDILPNLPSNQFNHVFLAVPAKTDTLWFECTSQTSPPAYTGTFTDDRYVLWVDQHESRLIRSPKFDADESVMRRKCLVRIAPSGDAQLDLSIMQSGMFYDEAMYYAHMTKDKIERFNYDKFHYRDFSLESFSTAFPDKAVPVLALDYQLNVNGLGKALGTRIILPSSILPPLEKSFPLDIMNRKTEVRRGFTIVDSVHVVLPENYRIGMIPEHILEAGDFGTYEIGFTTAENVIHIYRKAVIKKGSYENKYFDAFYEMVQKIKAIEQRKLVLQSKT